MSVGKRSIFRERALQRYIEKRGKDVLPRFVSPPIFLFLWVLIGLCLLSGWLAANVMLPISQPATGIVMESLATTGAEAILFVAAAQQSTVHVGEPVQIQIGTSGSTVQSQVTTIEPAILSPAQLRTLYQLNGQLALLVTQPSVVIEIELDPSISATTYVGSIVQAQIQVGEQSILSLYLS